MAMMGDKCVLFFEVINLKRNNLELGEALIAFEEVSKAVVDLTHEERATAFAAELGWLLLFVHMG